MHWKGITMGCTLTGAVKDQGQEVHFLGSKVFMMPKKRLPKQVGVVGYFGHKIPCKAHRGEARETNMWQNKQEKRNFLKTIVYLSILGYFFRVFFPLKFQFGSLFWWAVIFFRNFHLIVLCERLNPTNHFVLDIFGWKLFFSDKTPRSLTNDRFSLRGQINFDPLSSPSPLEAILRLPTRPFNLVGPPLLRSLLEVPSPPKPLPRPPQGPLWVPSPSYLHSSS